MYGEDKKTIERLVELAEDNNRMLHRLQRSRRWGTFFRSLYWLAILFIAAGFYYYIQGYIDQLSPFFPQLESIIKSLPVPGINESVSINSMPR